MPDFKIIRGGLVLDVVGRHVTKQDILIEGNLISQVGPPGMDAPDGALVLQGDDKLIIPGLVSSHTHGHGSLGKGLGDKW